MSVADENFTPDANFTPDPSTAPAVPAASPSPPPIANTAAPTADPNFTPDENFTPDPGPAPKDPDMSAMTKYTAQNVDTHLKSLLPAPAAEGAEPSPPGGIVPTPQKIAENLYEAAQAGWQTSFEGIVKKGSLPDTVLPQDASWAMRMVGMLGQIKGDLAPMAAGMFAGAEVGGLAGGAAGLAMGGTPALVGAPLGAALGGAYGAWAAPAGIRQALIMHYQRGDIKDPTDFLQRSGAVFIAQLKAGVTGMAAELTGGVAGGYAKFAGGAPLAVTGANLTAQVAAMTTIGKAMEGHLPKAQDFADTLTALGAFHLMTSVGGIATSAFPGNSGLPEGALVPSESPSGTKIDPQSPQGLALTAKLHDIYAKTGLRPEQVHADAVSDPAHMQELLSENVKFPTKYQGMVEPPQHGQEVFGPPTPKMIEMGSNSEGDRLLPGLSPDFTAQRSFQIEAPAEEKPRPVPGSNDAFRVLRHDEVGFDPKAERPQGLYTSLVDDVQTFQSPHEEAGPVRYEGTARPGNPLVLQGEKVSVGNRLTPGGGPVGGSAGVLALKNLVSATEFERLSNTGKPALIKELTEKYPGPDYSKFHDSYELLEAYGAQMAKTKGHDALILRDKEDPNFSEHVALDHRIIDWDGSGGGKPPGGPILSPESESIRGRWASTLPPEKRGLTWGDTKTALLDDTHPVKQLMDSLNGDKPALTADENPQIQLRRSRGAYAAADDVVKAGPRDFNSYARGDGAGLEDIFTRAKDPARFNDYLVAEAAVSVAKRGMKTGVDIDAAKAVIRKGKAEFGDLAQEVYKFRNGVLKYYADSGFLSDKEYGAMLKENNRVGMYRIQEPGTGGGPASRTIKGIKGSEGVIIAPSESLVKETYARIRAAEQNRVTTLLSDLYEANWEPTKLTDNPVADKNFPTRTVEGVKQINRSAEMQKIETQMAPVKVDAAEIQKYLDDNEIEGSAEKDLTTFRPQWRPLGKNEVENWRDGNREIFQVNQDVADAIKGIDPGNANLISKILSPPAKLLSVGATHNPFFLMKHWLRQEMMAGIISKDGYIPFVHAIAGTYHILANTQVYQDAQAAGALQGAITDVNKDYLQNSIFNLSKNTGLLDRGTQNVIGTPKELAIVGAKLMAQLIHAGEKGMTNASSVVFNSTKVAEFANVAAGGAVRSAAQSAAGYNFKMNASPQQLAEAAIAARDVSYDSSKVGAQVKAVNGLISFWHPRMQGVEQLGNAFARTGQAAADFAQDPSWEGFKETASVPLKMAAMASIGALLWWANRDDPRRKAGTRSEQDLYWHIMTDDWQPIPEKRMVSPEDYVRKNPQTGASEINMGTVYRVTKPFEAGIISSSLLERTLDSLYDKDPNSFKGFGDSIMHGMMPDTLLTAFVPAIEKAANKSILTGSTLIPHNLENVLPAEQYSHYTSDTAKVLGKLVSGMFPAGQGLNTPGSWASPIIIDNTVRAWSGEAGRYATALSDYMLQKSGVTPPKMGATPTLADNLFLHSFVARYPTMGDRQIQDFFDQYEATQAMVATAKVQTSRGDIPAAMAMRLAAAQEGDFTSVREALINQMHTVRSIDLNPSLSPNDKRQLEDGLIQMAVSAARQANERRETLKKALK